MIFLFLASRSRNAYGCFGNHILRSEAGSEAGVTEAQISAFATAAHYAANTERVDSPLLMVSSCDTYNGLGLCMISLHPRFSSHGFAGPAVALASLPLSSIRRRRIRLCTVRVALMVGNRSRILGPVTSLGGIIAIAGCAAATIETTDQLILTDYSLKNTYPLHFKYLIKLASIPVT